MKLLIKNQRNNKIEDIILVSFGVLEYEGGEYFGKSAVINYLHAISEYFTNTYFITSIHNGKKNFNTKLDTNKVEPIGIGYNEQDNRYFQLSCLARDQIKLAKLVTRKTAVIFNSPTIWFTPILPLISIKSGHLSGYMAGNPKGVARLQFSKGDIDNIFKSKITILYGKLISILSDSLIVRGDISPYQKYGSKVYQSKPIVALGNRPSSKNKDTCIKNKITILYVGGLYENKGIDILMNAFAHLVKKDISNKKSLNLKIIGDGGEYENLLFESHKLGLDNKIKFTGWVDDPKRLAREYISSDIFVLPTVTTEAGPRVVDEAMYYGIPVIATDHGYGNSFKHKNNVYLIKPNSIIELEKALEEIMNDGELRKKLIENGRRRIGNIMQGGTAVTQHANIIKGNL